MRQDVLLFRRFARTLAGSRSLGDAVIAATLKQDFLSETTNSDEHALKYRATIAKRVIELWNASISDVDAETPATPPHHVAFLLSALEGFSIAQIAESIGKDVQQTSKLIDRASVEIADQMSARILIVEDDMLIASDLESHVTSLGHIVTGIAPTKSKALEITSARPCDLILSDVELSDGSSGIETVNALNVDRNIPTIYITGHSDDVLSGAADEAAFLLSKPYNPKELAALIRQALFFSEDYFAEH